MAKKPNLLSPEMLSKLSAAVLKARLTVEGTLGGIHESPHKGSSVEFLEHRRYSPGDDIKHLDWKLLARSDKQYVKQFEDETNLRAVLVVDSSASMGYGPEGPSKLEVASLAAASLAWLLLSQSDAVGLLSQAGTRRLYVPPRAGWAHFRSLAEALEGLEPQGCNVWLDHLVELSGSFHKHGMFVILSDLLADRFEVRTALRLLRGRNHEVIIFQVLHPYEIEFPFTDPTLFSDIEKPAREALTDPQTCREKYQKALRELCEFYRVEATSMGMDYHLMRCDSGWEDALIHYLAFRQARA
jgi:uncharacterized protein (DUF58 family)